MRNYKYWIALEQVQGIGPAHMKEIYDILETYSLSIVDIFDLTPEEIKGEFSLSAKIADAVDRAGNSLSTIERDYFNLLEASVDIILFFEDIYPERLKQKLKSFPPILYTYGNRDILNKKGAAILGDSDVSEKGNNISYLAARELARHNISIISGFARGVDTTAHRSALENRGETIALLPCGMFHLKIPDILKDIFNPEKFLIVSTFYPSTEFTKFNAYNRNRIICALSHAVYIVESPVEGGVFEAGKSAQKVDVPLFVTEYSKYTRSSAGNIKLINEYIGTPIRGRMQNDQLIPNLDKMMGVVKFSD